MIKQIFKTVAVLSLVAFAGQASADTINGTWGASGSSADFSWEIKSDGELVIAITNTSAFEGLVTNFQFDLGGNGTISGLDSVNGTLADSEWQYSTNARGCFTSDCVITGRGFWGWPAGTGIAAGATARFRFLGDFTDLTEIGGVLVTFHGTGQSGWGRGLGWGCGYGCEASEVPEPGTLLMFAAGLLGFGLVARRRRMI